MISSLSDTNRYVLPVNASAGQGTSYDARAPDGYKGSTEGLAAGERVQTGLETQRATAGAREQPARAPRTASVRPQQPAVTTEVSAQATAAALRPDQEQPGAQLQPGPKRPSVLPESDAERTREASDASDPTSELDLGEQHALNRLKQRDAEVRNHEQAHAGSGGSYAGQPSYEFERGPDGRQYATGGEVSIDASPVPGDPQATIDKMRVVRRAALAPAEPSAQDRKVAAEASRTEAAARRELAEQQRAEHATEADGTGLEGPFSGPVNPFADDGFTAADVGQRDEDEEDAPGGVAASAVKRARSELAFIGRRAFGQKSLEDA